MTCRRLRAGPRLLVGWRETLVAVVLGVLAVTSAVPLPASATTGRSGSAATGPETMSAGDGTDIRPTGSR